MQLHLSFAEAALFLPFVAPLCLWVIWSDLSRMKIPNAANFALVAVFVLLGLLVLDPGSFGWRLLQLVIVLALAFLANIIGMMGAGDSKFLAAAAPFVAPSDTVSILFLLAAITLCAVAVHRAAKKSTLRQMAPGWESWKNDEKFPMGFALGGTLIAYLAMGLVWGL